MSFGYDPTDMWSHPLAVSFRAHHDGTMWRIREAVDAGQQITREMVDAFEQDAWSELAQREVDEAKRRGGPPGPQPTYTFVRIMPGMVRRDWDAIADRVQKMHHRPVDDIDDMVARLLQEGRSTNGVARLLGLSWSTVKEIGNKARPSSRRSS